MKKISFLIVTLYIISFLTSCQSSFFTLDKIIKSGKLLVTTNAEFAPFEYKQGSKFKGIDIDIIYEYGKYIDVEVSILDFDFDAALLSVSKYKSDLAIAAITKNEIREQTLDFSNSYYSANQVVIVNKNSIYSTLSTKDEILNALSVNKAKIGCQRGTTGQYYILGDTSWDFDGISNTSCITYDSGALAIKALSNGQIDAVIIDQAPAMLYCNKINGVKCLDAILTVEEYAIAIANGNVTLQDSLNKFIEKIKGDGTLDAIIEKYYEN